MLRAIRRRLPDEAIVFAWAVSLSTALAVFRRTWRHAFYNDYGHIALNLARGDGFSVPYNGELAPSSMMAPLVPFIQAPVYWLLGNLESTRVRDHVAAHSVLLAINIAMYGLMMVLLYRVTTRVAQASGRFDGTRARGLRPEHVGLGTALAAACYPPFLYYSLLLTEVPWEISAFLAALLLLYATPLMYARAAWAGAAMGVAALAHPTSLFFVPAMILWLLRAGRSRWPGVVGAFLATGLVVTSPWVIRDYFVLGRLVPVKSNLGICMYVANMPGSTGLNYPQHHNQILPLINPVKGPFVSASLSDEVNREILHFNEIEKQSYFMKKTFALIRDDPLRYATLSAKRLGVHLTYAWGRTDRPNYSTRAGLLYMVMFLPLVAAALYGYFGPLGLRRVDRARLIAACAISVAIGFSLTYAGDLRYKQTLDTLMFVLAGPGAAWLIAGRRSG